MMNWINGKKTYLGMIGLGALAICFEVGWIEGSHAKVIAYALSSWTGVAMTHAYKKRK